MTYPILMGGITILNFFFFPCLPFFLKFISHHHHILPSTTALRWHRRCLIPCLGRSAIEHRCRPSAKYPSGKAQRHLRPSSIVFQRLTPVSLSFSFLLLPTSDPPLFLPSEFICIALPPPNFDAQNIPSSDFDTHKFPTTRVRLIEGRRCKTSTHRAFPH